LDEELYYKFYKVETIHWWFSARREIILDFIINYIKLDKISKILDYGCGTGGIIDILNKYFNNIYGTDNSKSAIDFCRKRNLFNTFLLNDFNNNQIFNNYFDLITIAYGVRNFENINKAMSECYRVLKDNGIIAILEFGKVNNKFLKLFFNFYFTKILPYLGAFFSKNKNAYIYLPESVMTFPNGNDFISILQKNGFKNCYFKNFSAGISLLYVGFK